MKKSKNIKNGTLFWITGLSGSGKTTIAETRKKTITERYGQTLTIRGDDLRKLFNYNNFSRRNTVTYALS